MVNLICPKFDVDKCLRIENYLVCQYLKVKNCALCCLINSVEY